MIFTLNKNIYLVERREDRLVRHDRTANCKHAYSFVNQAGEVIFRPCAVSIPVLTHIPRYTFSNKGVSGLGWMAFSKYSEKLLMMVDMRTEISYGIIMYDDLQKSEIGSIYSIDPNVVERCPDDFQFCLELGETIDYKYEKK